MARIDSLARLLAFASGRRPARRPRLYQRRRSLRRGERRWRRAGRLAARIDSARRDARAYFWRIRSGRDSAISVRGDPFDRGGKREWRVETWAATAVRRWRDGCGEAVGARSGMAGRVAAGIDRDSDV